MSSHLVVGGFFVVFGLAVFLFGAYRYGYPAYRLWRSGPVSVREAARQTGVDEFEGVVRPEETFRSPFSGETAVLTAYTVRRKSGQDNDWTTVERDIIGRPFCVEDDTGCVLVDPAGIEVSPETGTGAESATAEREESASDRLSEATRLRLSGLTDEMDLDSVLAQTASRSRRYFEESIGPGDRVHVYGTRVVERTPERSGIDARVASAPGERLYRVSPGDERAVLRRYAVRALSAGAVALVSTGAGVFVILAGAG